METNGVGKPSISFRLTVPNWRKSTTPSKLLSLNIPISSDTTFAFPLTEQILVSQAVPMQWIGGTNVFRNGPVGRNNAICRLSSRGGAHQNWRKDFLSPSRSDDCITGLAITVSIKTGFHERLAEAIRAAGPRYSPQHHVELDIAESLEDFARTIDSFNRIKSLAIDVRQRALYLRHPRANDHQSLDVPGASTPIGCGGFSLG